MRTLYFSVVHTDNYLPKINKSPSPNFYYKSDTHNLSEVF